MMGFRFAYPLAFVFALIPVIIYFVPGLVRFRPVVETLRFSDIRLMQGIPSGWRVRLRYLPDVLRYIAFVLLVTALARPQTGQAREIIRGQGIDIVLVLDISTSMAALDFEPQNRLQAAKAVIGDFISGREFDRIGLVVFARNAYHQAPLTLDYPILLRLLDEIELVSELRQVEGRRLDGTAIGLGLASAANMLRASAAPSKTIILLTDGDNNASIDPFLAAQAASLYDIGIYTIGMGKPGLVNVPDREGNIQSIESDLNEDALRMIASIGGGLYFRAEDTLGLQQIYDQIDAMERSEAERRIFVRWQDQAWVLLVPGLIFLLSERLLRHSVFQTFP